MTNVVVVDDHPLIREGLINILEEEPNLKVVGEAGNAPEAQRLLKKNAVDIAVLDISLPGKDGLELMKDIKLRYPHLSVLILSMHPEDRFAIRALKGGASGYVTKEMAPEELVKAINQILGGRKYISNNLAEKLAEIISIDSEKPPHESLSDREFQVFM
ncbi:MAG: response regulator transcription factor, partial [Calditrichia bacterium]